MSRRRAIGPVGEPIVLLRHEHFDERYSASCLIQLNVSTPIFFTLRKKSNNQLDFIRFLMNCIDKHYLQTGDYLVCDNAQIHGGSDTFNLLDDLLKAARIKLVYLPAYSPELNPIELVFGLVKRFLRENRHRNIPLWFDITAAFAVINIEDVIRFYSHCLQ